MAKTKTKTTPAKLYSFTDNPGHQEQLKAWAERWIANALSTKSMDDEDRARATKAVNGLYRAAKLAPPPEHRIAFASSPLSGAIATGVAAGVWWVRDNPVEAAKLFGRVPLEDELQAALVAACRHVTWAGMKRLRGEPIETPKAPPLDAATYAATRAATALATYAATRAATYAATYAATDAATRAATDLPHLIRFLVWCCGNANRMYQGGNEWSAWAGYLSFFRHVSKLPIDWSTWQDWETLAEVSSRRYIHAKFAVVCDRPEVLAVDRQRLHSTTGPAKRWRDGWAVYQVRGVEVPAAWVESPEMLDPRTALTWPNVEQRRIAAELIGWRRVLEHMQTRTIDTDADPGIGQLLEGTLDGAAARFLRVLCGTGRLFVLPVPVTCKTAREANAWTWGLAPEEYHPEIRT